NSEEDFELELSTERSTLSPAAACSPTGQPPSRAAARAGGVCVGLACCGGRITVVAAEGWTIVAAARRCTGRAAVDGEGAGLWCAGPEFPARVVGVEPWLDALGGGGGAGEPLCEWGAASGLGPACADPAANAAANSAQQRTMTLPTALFLA